MLSIQSSTSPSQNTADPIAATPESSDPPDTHLLGSSPADRSLWSPDMTAPAGSVAEVAALLVRSLREDRTQAREASDLEELNRMREGEERVAALHEKADEIRKEGWAKGLSQIASSACSIAGGVGGLGATDKIGSQAALSIWSGGAKCFEGVGSITANRYQANAVESQAQADLHESRAEGHKAARDRSAEEAADAKQMIQRVIELEKEMNDARNATLQAAATLKA